MTNASSSDSKASDSKAPSVGGIPFFLSMVVLILLSCVIAILLPGLVYEDSPIRWVLFLSGAAGGAVVAHLFIGGHLAVFLHELKHAVVSNLSGNRARGIKIRENHGHYEYAYTARTAHMNAIISLAPYFFPATMVPMVLVAALVFSWIPAIPLLCGGFGYAIDLVIAYRDLGPWQTDLTTIRGGYRVGLGYVVVMNVTLFLLIAIWVTGGTAGFNLALLGLFEIIEGLLGVSPPQ